MNGVKRSAKCPVHSALCRFHLQQKFARVGLRNGMLWQGAQNQQGGKRQRGETGKTNQPMMEQIHVSLSCFMPLEIDGRTADSLRRGPLPKIFPRVPREAEQRARDL